MWIWVPWCSTYRGRSLVFTSVRVSPDWWREDPVSLTESCPLVTGLNIHHPHLTLASHHPPLTSHHPLLTSHRPQLTKYQPLRTFHQPLLTSHHLQTPLSSYLLIYWIHSIIRLRGLRASPYFSISQWNRHILDLYYYQYPFSYPHTLYLQSFIFLSTLMRNSNWIYFISSLLMSVLRIEFKYNQKTLKSVCMDLGIKVGVVASKAGNVGIHRETSRQMNIYW